MDRWANKIAVVTGASAGIGLETARALVREGMTVVGLARRKAKMESEMQSVKGKGKFYGYECDVSTEENVTAAFQWIKQNLGVVQVLVNNAGIAVEGTITDTTRADWEKVFGVNVMGLLMCTKLAVAMMKEAGVEGHIVNINSIEGHRVYIFDNMNINVYPATKHGVTAITESLQRELKGGKIRATSISPGFVNTSILAANGMKNASGRDWPGLESEDIAEAVVYVIGTPPRVQVTELTIRHIHETVT